MMGKFLLANISIILFSAISCLSQDNRIRDYIVPPGLSFNEEKPRLDKASKELKQFANKIVYLVGYNKEGTGKSKIMLRLKNSKQYLIKKYNIAPERIITGYKGINPNGITMYIFVVDRNLPSPFEGQTESK